MNLEWKLRDPWTPFKYTLDFEIGGLCLWRQKISGAAYDPALGALLDCPPPLLPEWNELPPKSNAILLSVNEKTPSKAIQWSEGRVCYRWRSTPWNYIDLTPFTSFDNYLARFSAKQRHNLHRMVRKFMEFSTAEKAVQEYRTASEVAEFLCIANEISKMSWQGKLGQGLPETKAFQEKLEGLAGIGAFRGFILRSSNNTPCAFALCRKDGATTIYDVIGYDPRTSNLSPGSVLLLKILERTFQEKDCKIFDFGYGPWWFKNFLATDAINYSTFLYLKPGPKNFLLVSSHLLLANFTKKLAEVSKKLGIKSAIKSMLARVSRHR